MGIKRIDKNIRMKIDTPKSVPDNINRIFDKFIDENVQGTSSARRTIIKPRFSMPQRIAAAAASVVTTMVTGGAIYAAITGTPITELFNINKDKYEQELISVNEEVTSSDISLNLQDYAIDHNAIVVNYVINTDKELNFSKDKDNFIADTVVNNDVKVQITKQNYAENNENKIYKISTLYAIEQFESSLDKFTLNISVKEIAGVQGTWNFSIEMDKSQKKENRTYSYNHTETRNAPRIALKTNYSAISMSVDNISVSDFSTVMNTTIFNGQDGVEDKDKVDPKNLPSYIAIDKNPEKWNEAVPLIFEVVDNNENVLCNEEYNYERGRIGNILNKKIVFPNVEKDITSLTLNIYSNYSEKGKEFLGKFDLNITSEVDTSVSKYELNKEGKTGNIKFKYSSEWKCSYDENHPEVTIYTTDDFGELINIEISEISSFSKDDPNYYVVYTDYSDIEKVVDEDIALARKMYTDFNVTSKGKEKIGIFDGIQVTANTQVLEESGESKRLYAIVNGKTYIISFEGRAEPFNEYMDYFYKVIESIEIE